MQTDFYFLVMENCPDGNLRNQILRKRSLQEKFDVEQVIDWSMQIASALKFCHDRKVIHRDLKVSTKPMILCSSTFQPDNIFLTHKGRRAKLGDFGLSIETEDSLMLASTQGIGTFQYMAPELLKGMSKLVFFRLVANYFR